MRPRLAAKVVCACMCVWVRVGVGVGGCVHKRALMNKNGSSFL